jgi:putative two-component system response regulator
LERQATHNERELTRTRNAVIFGLAKLAESRDNDTGEHLDRIRKYVEIISRDLANHCNDIDEEFTRNISLASSLHDIGKVGIPDSILLKPGRLTPEERSMMQIHTLIGGECLDAIHARLGNNPFMHMARQIAYYHHERWDGEGYPHQLKEYDIPLVARIVAVADVYDALTSKRPYKRAMSHLESRAIIVSGSGSQFDPEVVAAFIRHEDEFEAISRGQQSLSDDQAKSAFAKLHGEAQAASEKEAQTS